MLTICQEVYKQSVITKQLCCYTYFTDKETELPHTFSNFIHHSSNIYQGVLSVPGTGLSQVIELTSAGARVWAWLPLTLCSGCHSKGSRYYTNKVLSMEYNLDISYL